MQIDATSLKDLAIFHAENDQSVANKLNFCTTIGGRQWLHFLLSHPHSERKIIYQTQETLKAIAAHINQWPTSISNGTIMVLERWYESQIDDLPQDNSWISAYTYRIFHPHDFFLTRYTVGHAIDFLQGMEKLCLLFESCKEVTILQQFALRIHQLLAAKEVQELIQFPSNKKPNIRQVVQLGHFLLLRYKNELLTLIDLFSKLDAYYSLAKATIVYQLHFPEIIEDERPYIAAHALYHILLAKPVPYHMTMTEKNNFIFLTGANMAGKSTYIKSVGLAVYLAHLGMAVPAASMQLTLFHGLLSNIEVSDNITKGESFFFNEVQRIKNTIIKINNGQKWLVLIDELFKGTNVQDAMRCSLAVIKGLLKIRKSLFILSTHLYEIGEELKDVPNIACRYFETTVIDDQLSFSYQLKEGISNDRLGFIILKREGVVEMLEQL